MDNASFRPTSRQRRNLLLFTIGCAIVSAALLTAVFAGHVDSSGRVLGFGLGFGMSFLLGATVLAQYRRAFTTCSAEGIQSRGLSGSKRSCPWGQVEDIRVRQSDPRRPPPTFTVTVFTTSGGHFTLGAPVSGGLMPDPDFEAKVRRIRSCWWAATGMNQDREMTDPIPGYVGTAPSVPVRAVVHWSVGLIFAAALVALPFAISAGGQALAVRLGSGQPGTFSVLSTSCAGTCFWVGNFRGRDGAAVPGLAMAPGASIASSGAQIPAVYPGHGGLAYPTGGGTTWIPLAVVILAIAGCAPATAYWIIRWRAARRHMGRPEPPRGRELGQYGLGLVLAALFVVIAVGGAVIDVTADEIPAAGSLPTAVACADFNAWVQAQGDGSGPLAKDPALLAEAQQNAPAGQLSVDLDTLATDVSSSVAAGNSMAGLADQVQAINAMKAVTSDCFG